ncbi:MAG: uroporphyrinogen-III synthase [Planctomycetaceae bacterium]
MAQYDWLIFTSENGVNYFHDFLWEGGLDNRALAHCKLASIGSSTAKALEKFSLRSDLVPPDFRAESLAETLKPQAAGKKILWVRANRGRDILPRELGPVCEQFDELVVYEHEDIRQWSPEQIAQIKTGGLDWIGLSSPAIARNLKQLIEADAELKNTLSQTRFAALSPVTGEAAEEIGLPVHLTSEVYTWDHLLHSIASFVSPEQTF